MNILFATGQPFTPQMYGGLQASANELALLLKARGHKVSLLCALMSKGFLGLRGRLIIKLLRHKAAHDTQLGYPVYRAWFPWESVEWVAGRVKPDIIIVLARQPVRVALAAQRTGIPVLMMLQDVEFGDHGGLFAQLGNVPCIANSQFTANRYREAFGLNPTVIHPIMDPHKYKTETTRENITLINPHHLKGVDIAIEVARQCPDIPFSFVETWPLKPEEHRALEQALAELPNVTLRPGMRDMRHIYGKCKILLVPSRWEEGFGRVASEAHFSGIPVVASNRGGLSEAVGNGGILLDPDSSVDNWVAAVKRLWHEEAYYAGFSAAAYVNSERLTQKQDIQLNSWETAIMAALNKPTHA